MEHLFFSLDGDFDTVVSRVFGALGIEAYRRGQRANSLGGTYDDYSVFGVAIKIERNSYDYEDEFEYMMSVKHDEISNAQASEDVVRAVAEIVKVQLLKNLSIQIGIEIGNEVQIVTP